MGALKKTGAFLGISAALTVGGLVAGSKVGIIVPSDNPNFLFDFDIGKSKQVSSSAYDSVQSLNPLSERGSDKSGTTNQAGKPESASAAATAKPDPAKVALFKPIVKSITEGAKYKCPDSPEYQHRLIKGNPNSMACLALSRTFVAPSGQIVFGLQKNPNDPTFYRLNAATIANFDPEVCKDLTSRTSSYASFLLKNSGLLPAGRQPDILIQVDPATRSVCDTYSPDGEPIPDKQPDASGT